MASAETLMHPLRLRIVQFAAARERFTIAELANGMHDVAQATLYRHMRSLTQAKVLQVVGEVKVRALTQHEYALNRDSVVASADGEAGIQNSVYAIIGKLMDDFRTYFSAEQTDPVKDRIFLGINALYLDDEAFEGFIGEVFSVVSKYTQNPSPQGKARMITIVSSPAGQGDTARKEE